MCMLGIEPRFSGRTAAKLMTKPFLQPMISTPNYKHEYRLKYTIHAEVKGQHMGISSFYHVGVREQTGLVVSC